MKQFWYALIIFSVVWTISIHSFGKIWRVNNTGVPADFTTAQAAADAAQVLAGDTLHFEPSGASYGNLSLTKRLIILGNGFFLGNPVNNANPDLQANIANSKLSFVYFNTGSAGTVMMGMHCGDIHFGSGGLINDIVFKRNFCTNIWFAVDGSNNILVAQNNIGGFILSNFGTHTNLVIINNMIGTFVVFSGDDNGMLSNNIIGTNDMGPVYLTLVAFVVRNNIRIKNPAPSNMTLISCTVQNNMDCTGNNGFGNIDGNLADVDMSTVFIGWPDIGNKSFDGRFTLKESSSAAGSGYGGSDMGPILRTTNANNNISDSYVLSGMPNIPSVFKLDASGTVSTSTLNFIIGLRTNH